MTVSPNYITDASGYQGWADDVVIPAGERDVIAPLEHPGRRHLPATIDNAEPMASGCPPE